MENSLNKKIESENTAKDQATNIAESVYEDRGTQYGVPDVPVHIHDGVDSPILPATSLDLVEVLPAIIKGVVSPTVLGNQSVDNPAQAGFGNPAQIPVVPLPIIYGYGTTSSITMTGTPSIGALSATLTGAWGGTTGTYAVVFNSTEIRNVLFTNSSTALTWKEPLVWPAGSATATLIDNSRFKGGSAPEGTVIGFRNDDDNLYQIWIKTLTGTNPSTWIGFEADYNILGYD